MSAYNDKEIVQRKLLSGLPITRENSGGKQERTRIEFLYCGRNVLAKLTDLKP